MQEYLADFGAPEFPDETIPVQKLVTEPYEVKESAAPRGFRAADTVVATVLGTESCCLPGSCHSFT